MLILSLLAATAVVPDPDYSGLGWFHASQSGMTAPQLVVHIEQWNNRLPPDDPHWEVAVTIGRTPARSEPASYIALRIRDGAVQSADTRDCGADAVLLEVSNLAPDYLFAPRPDTDDQWPLPQGGGAGTSYTVHSTSAQKPAAGEERSGAAELQVSLTATRGPIAAWGERFRDALNQCEWVPEPALKPPPVARVSITDRVGN
ncbi:hypothetical protein [Brevundimonas sp. GCM10030266]|uniref:hypothetical protein n=1 Tax=Brevundimonas sp. GCM10030266 TaxID=3273386 RepID=UPI003615D165